MELTYDLLTKCQLKLKACKLQKTDELEIEMLLLRLKKSFLLMVNPCAADSLESFEAGILQMYDEISDLGNFCDGSQYSSRVQKLIKTVKRLGDCQFEVSL